MQEIDQEVEAGREESALPENKEQSEASPFALLFELEQVATPGRRAVFNVLSSILGDNDIKLNALQFAKSCSLSSPADALTRLLDDAGAKKLSVEKIKQDLSSGIAMSLTSSEAQLHPGFDAVLKAAAARGVLVAAVTALAPATAKAVMTRLGLDKRGVKLFPYDGTEQSFPRADTWLKISKSLGRTPRHCAAFVSSAASCRSALSAGMHCVAVPDEFTAFQDFGGSDQVLENYDDVRPSDLLEVIFPKD